MQVTDFGFGLHRIGGHDLYFEADGQDLRDGTYQYFSFLSSNGAWIIQRFDLSTPNVILYRYAFGKSNLPNMSNWSSQTYVSYDLVGK